MDEGGGTTHRRSTDLRARGWSRAGVTGEADELLGVLIDGRYEVLERVGAGAMGIVYRARHVHLEGFVAIKVVRAALSQLSGAVERFRREAQAASAIGDPRIAVVRDFGRLPDGRAYLVMEHVDGSGLDVHLAAGPFPWERAVSVARQLALGLASAHAAGIVHRDLKPENVLLVPRGDDDRVKIVDFGVAKLERAAAKITAAGQLVGTPQYMSPEQCAGADVDHRTDVSLARDDPLRDGHGRPAVRGRRHRRAAAAPAARDAEASVGALRDPAGARAGDPHLPRQGSRRPLRVDGRARAGAGAGGRRTGRGDRADGCRAGDAAPPRRTAGARPRRARDPRAHRGRGGARHLAADARERALAQRSPRPGAAAGPAGHPGRLDAGRGGRAGSRRRSPRPPSASRRIRRAPPCSPRASCSA
ncbi:MAG: serine/threonine protein kinase [Sandaracinaceae bacterium]|nr:serine/threonine protein kinase [Sandaracinaceae bacterium]